LFSGAGTIFGQGGQNRERQSREREIKIFAGIGAFFVPKRSVLQKKGLRRIWAFLCPKNGSEYKSQGGQKSPRGGQNISRGGSCLPCLPTSRAYAIVAMNNHDYTRTTKAMCDKLLVFAAFSPFIIFDLKTNRLNFLDQF